MEFSGKVALVTGGSSGIGLAVARQLAASGAHVWIIGRNQERLDSAIKEIRSAQINPNQQSGCLSADVSKAEQVQESVDFIEKTIGSPELVVTSAGVTHPGYFEELDLEIFREMIEINYLGSVYTVKAVLPAMLKKKSGNIVMLSSMAGFLGTFGYTAYGASKYAIRGFADTLRAEMKPKGINISIVFPPDTDTPQLAYENTIKPFETKEFSGTIKPISADSVAAAILHGAARNRYTIIPGFEGKFIYRLIGLVGDWTYPIVDWMISDAVKKKAKLGIV